LLQHAMKVLRKRFLKTDTIRLISTGGYSGNVKYSKKALMWLVYRVKTDGCKIYTSRPKRARVQIARTLSPGRRRVLPRDRERYTSFSGVISAVIPDYLSVTSLPCVETPQLRVTNIRWRDSSRSRGQVIK